MRSSLCREYVTVGIFNSRLRTSFRGLGSAPKLELSVRGTNISKTAVSGESIVIVFDCVVVEQPVTLSPSWVIPDLAGATYRGRWARQCAGSALPSQCLAMGGAACKSTTSIIYFHSKFLQLAE